MGGGRKGNEVEHCKRYRERGRNYRRSEEESEKDTLRKALSFKARES